MFKSFEFIAPRYPKKTQFKIIDDDFIVYSNKYPDAWRNIIEEYSKRNLNVGLNLALATIYYIEKTGIYKQKILSAHDKFYCSIPNWKEIKKSRDLYLKKLLLLK